MFLELESSIGIRSSNSSIISSAVITEVFTVLEM